MSTKVKNYGLVIEPLAPEDFQFGGELSLDAKYGDVALHSGDWTPYIRINENQSTSTGDTFACVPHGMTQAIALLSKYHFDTPIDLSARYIAKLGGVVVGVGSSPKKIADFIRKNWSVLEEEWPDVDTVEEYYAPVPEKLKVLATSRGAEFEFGYEYVSTSRPVLKEALKFGTVCVSVPAWFKGDNYYYRPEGISDNHWVTLVKVRDDGRYVIQDSFPPYKKVLEPECIQGIAQRYYLKRQIVNEAPWKKFLRDIINYLRYL